jgi:hypothetical protein
MSLNSLSAYYMISNYNEPACQNVLVVMTKCANWHILLSAAGDN